MRLFTKRKALLASMAAATLVLASCGSGATSDSGPEARELSADMEAVYDVNATERENLQDGGNLTLPVGGLGPNYNRLTNAGNTADNTTVLSAMDAASIWKLAADGEFLINTDFAVSAEQEITEDGVQKLHYELNPDAVWNDGTPITWETYEHTVSIRNGEDEAYDLVSTLGYEDIESVERGDDDYSFTVTMKQMYQPWQNLFWGNIIHPDLNDPDTFNNGFVDNIRNEWRTGPFELDTLDTAARVAVLKRNENWWGETPALDTLTFRAIESSASIPAFQNGEIDAVSVRTGPRYAEIQGTANMEIRRGQRMATCGYIFNTEATNLNDVAVRKAIMQAIDRAQVVDIQFGDVNWTEDTPGSWILMPFDENYEDNYPVDYDVAAARQTLLDAGYVGDEGIVTKDGVPLEVNLNSFGDDPTTNAMVQAVQSMVGEAGIQINIVNRGSGQFAETVGSRDFGFVNMCYTKNSADPTSSVKQFYSTASGNLTGAGSAELDEKIAEVAQIEDAIERKTRANEVEAEALGEFFHYLPMSNGPDITAVRTGLANWGPSLFESTDWTMVGWVQE